LDFNTSSAPFDSDGVRSRKVLVIGMAYSRIIYHQNVMQIILV